MFKWQGKKRGPAKKPALFFSHRLSHASQAGTKKDLACLEIPNPKLQIPNKAASFGPVF
jgi:hypothetical protein